MKSCQCILWLLPVVVVLVAFGCGKGPCCPSATGDQQNPSAVAEQPAADAEVALCGDCGEVKGSAACCDKDAARCDKCDLIKGSPGCCKINKS